MRFRSGLEAIVTILALVSFVPANAFATLEIEGTEAVRERLEWRGERAFVSIADKKWELITDPGSPAIVDRSKDQFYPMNRVEVEAALAEVPGISQFSGKIVILPYPRRALMRSSFRNGTIILSPGIRPIHPAHVHSTVVHELGHLVQSERAPEGSPAWDEYWRLRGLSPSDLNEHGAHKDRPREIFAEDFRFLVGGALATHSGTIENPDLVRPDLVPGLGAYFEELLSTPSSPDVAFAIAFPNPYRSGSGELTVRLSTAGRVRAPVEGSVHDVSGRLVRSLRGRPLDSTTAELVWDGRDTAGRRVSSGVYFVRSAVAARTTAVRIHVVR